MPKTSLYNLNNNAGGFTAIPSTIPARRVEVREDESGTSQGLQYQKPDDNFTNTYNVGTPAGPDQPQIVLGNVVGHLKGRGNLLGLPAQNTGGRIYTRNHVFESAFAECFNHDGSRGGIRMKKPHHSQLNDHHGDTETRRHGVYTEKSAIGEKQINLKS